MGVGNDMGQFPWALGDLVCRVTERGMVVCTSLPVSEQMGNMDEAGHDVNSTLTVVTM